MDFQNNFSSKFHKWYTCKQQLSYQMSVLGLTSYLANYQNWKLHQIISLVTSEESIQDELKQLQKPYR